ncbi:hypothetical protein J437_LFUL005219, partial [Ladona fulva]
MPPHITSSSNVVYISWNVSPMRVGSWFLLNWIQVPRRMDIVMPQINKTSERCGGFFNVNVTGLEFTSPGYPHGYGPNMRCEWIFETTSWNHILFSMNDINLQQHLPFCVFDFIEIYSGLSNNQEWNLEKTYCLQNATETPFHGTNLMKVVFETDFYRNGTGFSAHVNSVCGGSLSGSNGVIDVLNMTQYEGKYPKMIYMCEWTITVRSGRTIKVEFDAFDLYGVVDTSCTNAFIMFKNGGSSDSPGLGEPRYCGNTIPNVPETVGNRMYIKYKTFAGVK